MAYKPQFQGALPYSWGQKGYTQQPERMEQPNVFGSTLPSAWMLPPKMTTLEEQQMEIPEFQELTKKKEAVSGLKSEKQKAIDERIKIYQGELEKADAEFGSLAATPDNFYSMSYQDKKNREQKFIDTSNKVSNLRKILARLQNNQDNQNEELTTDINAKFKDRLAAATEEQAAALTKFEEAKKRVKYRPPAGVALDERGVPVTV